MLHKSDVSNLITGIRPKVKQSVIHLAHHLSKVVKQYENRKGKNAEKFNKKAESLRLETLLLKKIQPDDVSKYALMLDFSQREKLLGDINLPLETKVMIKIATHKVVASHLEDFRKKHPDWQEKLPDVMKTLGIRTQFKKKVEKQQEKSKRKLERKQKLEESALGDSSVLSNEGKQEVSTAKPQKKPVVKKTSLKELSDDSGEEGNEYESNEADSDDGNEDSADDDENDDSADDDGNEDSVDDDENDDSADDDENEDTADDDENDSSDNSDEEDEDSDIGNDQSERKTSAVKSKKQINIKPSAKKMETRVSSGSGIAEVRRFADLQKDNNSDRYLSSRKVNISSARIPSPDPTENEPVEEDTFFMTGANRFLKTVSVRRENGEGVFPTIDKNVQDSTEIKELWSAEGKNLPGNRRQRRAKITGRDLSKIKSKRMNSLEFDSSPQYHKNDRGFNHGENSNGKKGCRNQFDNNDKRKSNDFADTRNGRAFSDNKKFTKKDFSNKSTDETLHPSWEAKRKQKVVLDSFQGKKITFDDDNKPRGKPVQPNTADVNLHPSWEAKRKQKVALDSFQGKKIKFDDD